MSRRVFKWVSDLIKTKPDQTTIRAMSVIGYSVIERYQNGRIQNDKLLFTAQDKFQLRSKLKSEFDLTHFSPRNYLMTAWILLNFTTMKK